MSKRVVLLTGSELRHSFFRMYVSGNKGIDVIQTFCESRKGNLNEVVQKGGGVISHRMSHLAMREQTEKDFFEVFCQTVEDRSKPKYIERGDINREDIVQEIKDLNPDVIVSYGCSLIKSSLLDDFEGRFMNIHLGLSPYYRGAGTNYWPFVEKEVHLVGTTFMYIDAGVDTGNIIHQLRANVNYGDNVHQIGNRLIRDATIECVNLILSFNDLDKMEPLDFDVAREKYYRKKDFSEVSLDIMYTNFRENMISKYLIEQDALIRQSPIIQNTGLKSILV